MAIIVGCLEGCHGQQGEGGSEDAPGIFRATAPTLSEVLPNYSDPELVRLVRFGVKRDSMTAVGMPSATFYPMSDADLSRVIGYLRQRPVMPPVPRSREVMFVGRLALALGKWQTSADAVDETRPRWGHLPRITPVERGRYIASIVCSECHGLDMQGDPEIMKSPPLSVVRGYRIDQFRHLLRTGEPISGRDLGIMSITSRRAFVYFTDDEVADLYDYLRAQPVVARLKAGNWISSRSSSRHRSNRSYRVAARSSLNVRAEIRRDATHWASSLSHDDYRELTGPSQ